MAEAPTGDLLGHVVAIRAYVAGQQGDVPATVGLAYRALQLLHAESLGIRAVVYFVLGGAHLLGGDVAASAKAMAQAGGLGQQSGNIHVAVPALSALAGLRMQQGHMRLAQETAEQAMQLATGPSGRPLPIGAGALSALADLARERNDLEQALAQARRSVELSEQWGNSDTLCSSYLTLAEVLLATGDLATARDALHKAEEMARCLVVTPQVAVQLSAGWARLILAQGDLPAAVRWAHDAGSDRNGLGGVADPAEALSLVRVKIALGQYSEALHILAPLLEMAHARGLGGVLAEAGALEALIHQAMGAEDQALATLAEALALAEPQGYVRLFLDEGEHMARLLHKAAARGVAVEYAAWLLAQFEGETTKDERRKTQELPSSFVRRPSSLVESLSERELEVLRLVAAGASNPEIAQELVIALSTVKSHLNHVYGKLGVKNRTQAVAQARTLTLL